MNFREKKVAILGWGINGLDAYHFLKEKGAIVTIFDKKKIDELDFREVDTNDTKLVLGDNYLHKGLNDFYCIFRTPGVYRYIPELVEAEIKGVKITSVTKLFFDLCPGKIIGITGTKGKGTTSSLIYNILKNSRKDAYLAGNIGIPMLELLNNLDQESLVVLELSSFQLIDIRKSPHIAVVLNITEDHLDWHKDKDEYVSSKRQIVKFQENSDFAVINYDHLSSRNISNSTNAKVIFFSTKQKVNGTYISHGNIILGSKDDKIIGNTQDLLLRGEHNWENVCAAVSAAFLAGSSADSIKNAVFSFKGLEHRLELVAEIDKVNFYDDSFSTNPQTTIAAINSFNEPLTLILGGSDKGLDYSTMAEKICERENIKNTVLIGEITEKIKRKLKKQSFKGQIIDFGRSSMKEVVKMCFKLSKKGDVVLLSPASASFDMFTDYKDRGDQFKKAVMELKQSSIKF